MGAPVLINGTRYKFRITLAVALLSLAVVSAVDSASALQAGYGSVDTTGEVMSTNYAATDSGIPGESANQRLGISPAAFLFYAVPGRATIERAAPV
jgi:hypothetical protein